MNGWVQTLYQSPQSEADSAVADFIEGSHVGPSTSVVNTLFSAPSYPKPSLEPTPHLPRTGATLFADPLTSGPGILQGDAALEPGQPPSLEGAPYLDLSDCPSGYLEIPTDGTVMFYPPCRPSVRPFLTSCYSNFDYSCDTRAGVGGRPCLDGPGLVLNESITTLRNQLPNIGLKGFLCESQETLILSALRSLHLNQDLLKYTQCMVEEWLDQTSIENDFPNGWTWYDPEGVLNQIDEVVHPNPTPFGGELDAVMMSQGGSVVPLLTIALEDGLYGGDGFLDMTISSQYSASLGQISLSRHHTTWEAAFTAWRWGNEADKKCAIIMAIVELNHELQHVAEFSLFRHDGNVTDYEGMCSPWLVMDNTLKWIFSQRYLRGADSDSTCCKLYSRDTSVKFFQDCSTQISVLNDELIEGTEDQNDYRLACLSNYGSSLQTSMLRFGYECESPLLGPGPTLQVPFSPLVE